MTDNLSPQMKALQYQTIWQVLDDCGAGALGPIEPVVRKIQEALNALTVEDEPIEIDEMDDCPFCHNPYIKIETDNQIAKRKWSDFWDEVIDESNWDTDCPCTYFPEWLDKEEE